MLRTAIFGFIASFALIAGAAHQDAESDASDSVDVDATMLQVIVRADSLTETASVNHWVDQE